MSKCIFNVGCINCNLIGNLYFGSVRLSVGSLSPLHVFALVTEDVYSILYCKI